MKRLEDSSWVNNAFLLPKFNALQMDYRRKTDAFDIWTDTTLGGNFAINNPPQFTDSADLVVRGPFSGPRGNDGGTGFSRGMGRRYRETIDRNAQLIHMRFGVPQFNTMLRVFGGFYNVGAAQVSRTGRAHTSFYKLGRIVGTIVTLPFQPFILAGEAYRFFTRQPSTKYYFLKPTMPLYWQAVNGIANAIAVNMGIIPRAYPRTGSSVSTPATSDYPEGYDPTDEAQEELTFNQGDIFDGPEFSPADIQIYHDKMPDVFRRSGGVDVYAIASRANRMGQLVKQRYEQATEQLGDTFDYHELAAMHLQFMNEEIPKINPMDTVFAGGEGEDAKPGIRAYLAAWSENDVAKSNLENNEMGSDSIMDNVSSWADRFIEFTKSELADGGQYATFRVSHTGTISESISNSVGESDIKGLINGTSADIRSKRFSFMDGNIGGPLGEIANSAMASIHSLVGGALESVQLQGLLGIFGNAFIDIPKVWQDSSVQLPRHSYTVELRSVYGNKMSRYMNLMVPLSMLLAAALPKSTGPQSYDSPFLVEIYDKGRGQTRLGIIDSMNITRGVGNVGWTKDHEPLGINVEFSVVDLSDIMHMPIVAAPGLFDEYSAYNDYMATLASMSLDDMINPGSTFRYRVTQNITRFRTWFSPARHAQWVSNSTPGSVLRAFAREAERMRL